MRPSPSPIPPAPRPGHPPAPPRPPRVLAAPRKSQTYGVRVRRASALPGVQTRPCMSTPRPLPARPASRQPRPCPAPNRACGVTSSHRRRAASLVLPSTRPAPCPACSLRLDSRTHITPASRPRLAHSKVKPGSRRGRSDYRQYRSRSITGGIGRISVPSSCSIRYKLYLSSKVIRLIASPR